MALHRLGERSPRRVAILRALQLGDMLCAVPALRAIRAALPDAALVLIGLPWARAFVQRYSIYLDEFREFPGYPGLPERPPRPDLIPPFLQEMQSESFDLIIQMHGSGTITNPLTVLMGAVMTAGFYQPGGYRPDPERYLPYPETGLEIDRLLALVEFLGIPAQGTELEFPLTPADHARLETVPHASELEPGRYVCVHVGASTAARRWQPEYFARVADWLLERGLTVVLTGTAAEAGLTAEVENQVSGHVINLAGATDLGSLGQLLSRAAMLVCNDTGVSHLADALRVPSVVISTADHPARWAPRDTSRHRVLCRAETVPVQDVIEQVSLILSHHRERTAAGSSGKQAALSAPASAGFPARRSCGRWVTETISP